MMEDQILLMLEAFPLTIVKTGMLGSAEHVHRVAEIFKKYPAIKLVVDPVMVASTGASLLTPEAVETYIHQLLPIAHIITPNLPEAATLLRQPIASLLEMEAAAHSLSTTFGCAVLLKGGHLNLPDCMDLLCENGQLHRFSSPRLHVLASHGTGCTLAAAVASLLALGETPVAAVRLAKNFLNQSLASSYHFTSPNGQHLHALNQGTIQF